ncbi:MAG: DNA polymerase [Ignavibacteriae bacterium]|nr:DNA polymerase [Ignavibacteriota bacterium]
MLLSGHNPEPRIIAVDHTEDGAMRLTFRTGTRLATRDEAFYPFFHLADATLIEGFPQKHWVRRMAGDHRFAYLCVFEGWSVMWDAIRYLVDRFNRRVPTGIEGFTELDGLHVTTDPVTQFLLQSGRTLFKEMAFEDLHRLQLDIETYTVPGGTFSRATRPGDRIILIALMDNRGWEHVIDGRRADEPAMLKELIKIIRQRDPDVLEGHNILGFDLPYILRRCALHTIAPAFGRDGRAVRMPEGRGGNADATLEFAAADIAGRHVIDTLDLVRAYDSTKRTMESHGLKYAARYFGVSSPDRVMVDGDRIAQTWDEDPDTLVRYALDDVHETARLSALLSPPSFHLTKMVPCSYGTVTRLGSALRIEHMLVREYLRQKHSLPQPVPGTQTGGGYTDIFYSGVLGPIVHADVESLYPSLMIARGIAPASDTLGIFTTMLRGLTTERLELKQQMRDAGDDGERARLDARQSSMKILINSFYGYLAYNRALFNDYRAADAVTGGGQEILRQIMQTLRDRSCKVIEVDTDGVFFVPPPDVNDEGSERTLVGVLAGTLPQGISLVMDGRYRRMLSYRKKNYALLGYDHRLLVRGSSLISRSMERFARSYIRQCIEHILDNDIDGLHRLYVGVAAAIASRALDIADFARSEVLHDPVEQYAQEVERGDRNKSAVYEVALATGRRYRVGDRVAYYIAGSDPGVRIADACKAAEEWDPHFPDENTGFYLRRLGELSTRFEDFFRPADFQRIFSNDDLFPFSADGIIIQTRSTGEEAQAPDDPSPSPGIWLDDDAI